MNLEIGVFEALFSPSILGGKHHPYFWFNTHLGNLL